MARFNNPNEFEKWLKDRTLRREEALVVALRAALRVLPLATIVREPKLTLAVFRAIALTRFAAQWPTHADELRVTIAKAADAAASAAAATIAGTADAATLYATTSTARVAAATAAAATAANTSTANITIAFAADAAAAAAAAAGAGAAYATTTSAAYAITTSTARTVADRAVNTAWKALSIDTAVLEIAPASALLNRTLWLASDERNKSGVAAAQEPEWIASSWKTLKQFLLADGQHWQVWIDWYEAVAKGKSPFPKLKGKARESLEMKIALIDDAEWKKGAKHVNELIKRLIDEAHAKLEDKKPQNRIEQPAPPEVPAQQPAAIEPTILPDGRVGLPRDPLQADLDEEGVEAALRALREGFA